MTIEISEVSAAGGVVDPAARAAAGMASAAAATAAGMAADAKANPTLTSAAIVAVGGDTTARAAAADAKANPSLTQSNVTAATAAGVVFADGVARAITNSVGGDKIVDPTTNLTAAAGAAGVLTGTYYYTQTYVTALGETAPWPGTATPAVLAAQSANLSAIPVGPAGVTGRRIYRTKSDSPDPKDYFFVAALDNVATTYIDNTPDASLGAAVNWQSSNRAYLTDGISRVAQFSGGSLSFGQNAMKTNVGYANTAIGPDALASLINGRRNVAVGVFAGTTLTTGQCNTFVGVHSGQLLTRSESNTFIGYAAGWNANGSNTNVNAGNFNVAVGREALYGQGIGLGTSNVAIGYRALWFIQGADNNIGIGAFAGKWSAASRKLFIDIFERANYAANQNQSIIHGGMETTPQVQELRLNASVRIGWDSATVAQLPAASNTYRGYRANVIDAVAAYTGANIGTTVVGGGTNVVPVFCTGTAWVIG